MSRKKVGVLTCIGGIDDPAKLFSIRKCVDTVIGTDLSKIAIGQNFVDIFIPEFTPQKFIDEIIYTFSEENDYYFFVGADEEALILSQIKNKFDHIHILLSNHKDLKKVLNKHLLYSELKNHDLPFPNYKLVKTLKDIYKALDDLDYGRNKIVVKPLFGRGGRGIYFLEKNRPTDMFLSKSETLPIESFVIMLKENKYIAKNKLKRPLIFCEYLSGDAWSVDYLSYDGELICAIPKKKISGNAFTTTHAKVVENTDIIDIVSKIIKIFNISYIGNIEIKYNNLQQPVVFDFNARIAASSGIYIDLDINLFKEAICLSDNGTCILSQGDIRYNSVIKKYLKEFVE